jgi:hypothetical protein
MPEKCVVPDLRAVVKQALIAAFFGCYNNFGKFLAVMIGAGNCVIGLTNICIMVLAMVIIEGVCGHHIAKGGFVKR